MLKEETVIDNRPDPLAISVEDEAACTTVFVSLKRDLLYQI